jgi:hypothetical protein
LTQVWLAIRARMLSQAGLETEARLPLVWMIGALP